MRSLLWISLPDQRVRRELYWLSRMPNTRVTALAAQKPEGDIDWVPTKYRRPIKRFIEAGAFAWARGINEHIAAHDWVASLELCSLVTGQASQVRKQSGKKIKQAVLTWENLPRQTLYSLPFYRQAFASSRDADLHLCFVDAARDHLLANGFSDETIRVVKPGIDTELFTPAAQMTAHPRVAFISPLAENKGIDRVLAAVSLVRQEIPDAELLVAGSGPLLPLVQQAQAESGGLTRHMGHLSTLEVSELLRKSAVFTTAPRSTWKWTEQFGLAYVEAQAAGLPVVTTACGTNDEAVLPPNLLVEDSVEALADGLLHFLNDYGLRSQVGKINRQHVEKHHDLRLQTQKFAEAFTEMESR